LKVADFGPQNLNPRPYLSLILVLAPIRTLLGGVIRERERSENAVFGKYGPRTAEEANVAEDRGYPADRRSIEAGGIAGGEGTEEAEAQQCSAAPDIACDLAPSSTRLYGAAYWPSSLDGVQPIGDLGGGAIECSWLFAAEPNRRSPDPFGN
jgi:hypothetical protein